MKTINLLMTGVGGQGVVLASDILSETAIAAGYDVKKTDTLGMAQRGGSVISHVRIAPEVWSPLIKRGEVDILISFEKLEAARWVHMLRPEGIVIANNQALPPLSVSLGIEQYPDDEAIYAIFKQYTDHFYLIEGEKRAEEIGNIKTLNLFMLGCVSTLLPIEIDFWESSIVNLLPAAIQKINITAFRNGRKEIGGVNIP